MWNNSANKFFDALAAGRAVLINYRGWQAELLKKRVRGLSSLLRILKRQLGCYATF